MGIYKMKKITNIQERVIKTKEKIEILCDVCNCEVKNYWFMTSYYDGVKYEYTSPIDLCEDHQHYYERALRALPFPFDYMEERYENEVSEDKVKILLEKVLHLYEDDH